MLEKDILERPPIVLSAAQRNEYFQRGVLVLPGYIGASWLARLRQASAELVERSRSVIASDDCFVLEEGHSAADPRLHRIRNPQVHHPVFWEFLGSAVMADLAADVVGPDVKFHHAKLNIKAGQGSRGFGWHQDIAGWPHTDFSPVTIGVYLDDCGDEQGPLTFIPGSNLGAINRIHDPSGAMIGIDAEVMKRNMAKGVMKAVGPAGTTVLISCRVIHGSERNRSDRPRPLLLPVFSSADSFPYTTSPLPSRHAGAIVRGGAAAFASFDPRPCPLPPDRPPEQRGPWTAKPKIEAEY